jgi:hypothetical protein
MKVVQSLFDSACTLPPHHPNAGSTFDDKGGSSAAHLDSASIQALAVAELGLNHSGQEDQGHQQGGGDGHLAKRCQASSHAASMASDVGEIREYCYMLILIGDKST